MRALAITCLLAVLGGAGSAGAQVVIDGTGVRSGGVVVDSRGVHARGADISARGVRAAGRSPGHAGVSVARNHLDARLDCHGGRAEIIGNDNHLVLEGCSGVSVPGNRNDITVSLLAPGVIEVPGNRNHVVYRTPAGASARVSVLGSGVVVSRRP